MDSEIWKPIKDYEGLYEVSNYGRVRSVDRYVNNRVSFRKGKVLKLRESWSYLSVSLNKNGVSKDYMVHRLVAEAFVLNPDPENKIYVNHLDGNKYNNIPDNLEWCTASENSKHAVRTGLISREDTLKGSKLGADKISIHILCENSGEVFKTITEARHRTGIQTVPCMKNIQQWTSHRGRGFTLIKIDNETYNSLKQVQSSIEEYDMIYEKIWNRVRSQGRPIRVYCKEQDLYYNSINEAANLNHMDNETINLALKEHRSCKGLTFIKVEDMKDSS